MSLLSFLHWRRCSPGKEWNEAPGQQPRRIRGPQSNSSHRIESCHQPVSFAMGWMFMSTLHSYVEIPTLKSDGVGRWLGHESGVTMDATCALIKETPLSSLAPSTVWGHRENLWSRREPSPDWIVPWFGLQPLELWEINEDISAAYKPPKFLVSCYSSLNGLRWAWKLILPQLKLDLDITAVLADTWTACSLVRV